MKKKLLVTISIFLLTLSTIPLNIAGDNSLVVDFPFKTTSEENVSVSDYYGDPILIEWAASWCTICERNQESIAEIYDEYKNRVTFISISFTLSGDNIGDVIQMKSERGYEWLFGLDTDNYSGDYDVYNGYNWLLDGEGQLLETWNGSIVTSSQFTSAFETHFGYENTYASEELIVGDQFYLVLFTILPALMLLGKVKKFD